MKKTFYFALLAIALASCKKHKIIPQEYIGIWTAETPQFLTYDMRIHTLIIYDDGNGTYTSIGQSKILNENDEGKVKIKDGMLIIKREKFTVNTPPYQDSLGIYQMKLNNLEFSKS